MRKVLPLFIFLASSAQAQEFVANWMDMVTRTQAEQPKWVAPVVTVTPRLEQVMRFDYVHSQTPSGDVWNLGNSKGLEIVPERHTELIVTLPPYFKRQNPSAKDGFGDVTFLMKYRLASKTEKEGNYIVTAFLGGSIPTGSYSNGSSAAVVTPTLAAGKGWGNWNVQSTVGIGLPVDSIEQIGHALQFNTAIQYHVGRFLWPELEQNTTHFSGGVRDRNTQTFLTPGIVFGKFIFHKRIGMMIGAGFQIAVTRFHANNHNLVITSRIPF